MGMMLYLLHLEGVSSHTKKANRFFLLLLDLNIIWNLYTYSRLFNPAIVKSDGLTFLVPDSLCNTTPCIFVFLNRNPVLVKVGQNMLLFDSHSTKVHLFLLR
jgi:hypothetical protein